MTLTKADERWLACMDCAIAMKEAGILDGGSYGVTTMATSLYKQMNEDVRGARVDARTHKEPQE